VATSPGQSSCKEFHCIISTPNYSYLLVDSSKRYTALGLQVLAQAERLIHICICKQAATKQASHCVVGLQGKDVSSVRQYIESIVVNLMLQNPVQSMQQYVVPSLQTYHAK